MLNLPYAQRGQYWLALLALIMLIGALAVSARRVVRAHQTPGPFDSARQGFCDFQNGVYFPSLAFSQGVSPYSQKYAREYPVARSIPFFSPVILAAHVPLTWLPLIQAESVYFLWMLFLIVGIAATVTAWTMPQWRWDLFFLIALAIVVLRSGQQTIFTGYFTFELVWASLVAVHYGKSRPWWSAIALILVSSKPNYVLPIALLMLCRGNFRAVIWGGIISASLAAACFAWIMPEGGVPALVEQIQVSQDIHRGDAIERPVNTWIRIDALAIVAKWLEWDPTEAVYLITMFLLLLPAGFLLWLYHRRVDCAGGATGLSGGLILLSSLVAVYHHVYDSLNLVALIVAMYVATGDWRNIPRRYRFALAICLLIPGLNYASSQKFLQVFGVEGLEYKLITSLNAVALLIAWVSLMVLLMQRVVQTTTKNRVEKAESCPS
jgi:hypothetical protein